MMSYKTSEEIGYALSTFENFRALKFLHELGMDFSKYDIPDDISVDWGMNDGVHIKIFSEGTSFIFNTTCLEIDLWSLQNDSDNENEEKDSIISEFGQEFYDLIRFTSNENLLIFKNAVPKTFELPKSLNYFFDFDVKVFNGHLLVFFDFLGEVKEALGAMVEIKELSEKE